MTSGWNGLGKNIRDDKNPHEQTSHPNTGRFHKFPSMHLLMVPKYSPIESPLSYLLLLVSVRIRQTLSRHFLAIFNVVCGFVTF